VVKTDTTVKKKRYTITMSLDTASKTFLNQDDILEEINRIKFMLDNLQKEKSVILGKNSTYKRKHDFITDDFEYDSDDTECCIFKDVKCSKIN